MESYWGQSLRATQPQVPMDASLLCNDDQTQPPLDSLGLFSPTENTLPACERGTEVVSDISDLLTELFSSTEPLSTPTCLPHDNSTDSDCCDIFNTQGSDFVVYSYFAPSEPISPLLDKPPELSHDLTSPPPKTLSLPSQTFSDFYTQHDSALTYTAQSFGLISSISESLTNRSVAKPGSHHCGSRERSPCRSLSHRSNSTAEVVTATEPLSELFIIESETQDFILSSQNPALDPQEIKCPDCLSSSQTGEQDADPDRDTHVPMCDSAEVVTQSYHRFIGEGDGAVADSESGRGPPAVDACEGALMSVNDASGGRGESSSVTSQALQSDSPDELWLDACQYLAGEDTGNVSCKTGRFVTEGGLSSAISDSSSSPQRDTKVFGYNTEEGDEIGLPNGGTGGWGPPVERWSSVDSWASALSDWAGIIADPPEDFTAAFTEIGAEIDALTQALLEAETRADSQTEKLAEILSKGEDRERTEVQALMAIQDKEQLTPGSSALSGQKCLPEAAGLSTSSELATQSGVSTPLTPGEEGPGEIQSSQAACAPFPTRQDSSVGSSCEHKEASPGRVNPVSTSSAVLDETATYLHHFGGRDDAMETDIYISHADEPVVLNITEDSDFERQNVPALLIIEEAFRDGVCQVTEDLTVSHPGLVAKQERKKSRGPLLSVPGPSSSEAEAPKLDREVTGGIKPSQALNFPDTHALKSSHVPGVDPQPGLYTRASSDTSVDLDRARQVEPQWGSPQFIMPVAPLSTGASLVCGTSNILDGDHTCAKRSLNDNRDLSCHHVQPEVLWPTFDGINKSSLEDKKGNIKDSVEKSPNEHTGQLDGGLFISDFYISDTVSVSQEICDLSRELSDLIIVPVEHFFVSQKDHLACITLDLHDPLVARATEPIIIPKRSDQTAERKTAAQMPHKSHKSTSECNKTRSKKEKSAGHHHGAQVSKKQENSCHHVPPEQACKIQDTRPLTGENIQDGLAGREDKDAKLVTMTESVAMEKVSAKPHGKKKKKHNQNVAAVKSGAELLAEVENGAKPKTTKGRIDMFEAKLGTKAGKAQKESDPTDGAKKKPQQPEDKASQGEQALNHGEHKNHKPASFTSPPNDDVIKRRRLSDDKFRKIVGVLDSKLTKPEASVQVKEEEAKLDVGATHRKAYSEVVKQKTITPKEDPKVVQPIQAASVSGEPQSLCLWCQFAAVFTDYTVTWSREGTVLAEIKRSAGDESRVSLTIPNASHKDLGKYQCRLSSLHGSVTLDYLLTYEVLSEIVIPVSLKNISLVPAEVVCEEEDVSCSRLMFKEDFLSDQYFGDNHPVSIITEKVHFGEGMHRRAFRTKLQAGLIPLSLPGHSCVLKVHNSISYGTKNSDELIQRNFSLAVEECQVQNTAREYIKAYTSVAQSVEAFGDVPEIIPIYLVHRPSNDIPYATLEEELIGDFVKYSVKDGKEINLMRRDSEAGQKCCAFQHWVYHITEGNLLVTDMQGVGMRLTDVGIATCKKGYKGFKGNCATSFIDQFKALHQCNKYCEILGLNSLQPKPKKPAASAPKAKPQPSAAPKKKTFGPTLKGKS